MILVLIVSYALLFSASNTAKAINDAVLGGDRTVDALAARVNDLKTRLQEKTTG